MSRGLREQVPRNFVCGNGFYQTGMGAPLSGLGSSVREVFQITNNFYQYNFHVKRSAINIFHE